MINSWLIEKTSLPTTVSQRRTGHKFLNDHFIKQLNREQLSAFIDLFIKTKSEIVEKQSINEIDDWATNE